MQLLEGLCLKGLTLWQSRRTKPKTYAMHHMGMGQNPIPLVNIKIAGKWMFIPLKMVCIGIDP
jgi:hypothetical protein